MNNGEILNIESPSDFPEPHHIKTIFEPIIKATGHHSQANIWVTS